MLQIRAFFFNKLWFILIYYLWPNNIGWYHGRNNWILRNNCNNYESRISNDDKLRSIRPEIRQLPLSQDRENENRDRSFCATGRRKLGTQRKEETREGSKEKRNVGEKTGGGFYSRVTRTAACDVESPCLEIILCNWSLAFARVLICWPNRNC